MPLRGMGMDVPKNPTVLTQRGDEPFTEEAMPGPTHIVAPIEQGQPVLDQQVLDELRQYSDDEQDLVQELVTLFLRETPMQLLALQQALNEANSEEVQRRSHRLKGSAGAIGASRLREMCEQIELYARNGTLPGPDETLASMNRELDAVSDELKHL
jgi:HPt (histidine-containing phosphotransfer) domain-containing protein